MGRGISRRQDLNLDRIDPFAQLGKLDARRLDITHRLQTVLRNTRRDTQGARLVNR